LRFLINKRWRLTGPKYRLQAFRVSDCIAYFKKKRYRSYNTYIFYMKRISIIYVPIRLLLIRITNKVRIVIVTRIYLTKCIKNNKYYYKKKFMPYTYYMIQTLNINGYCWTPKSFIYYSNIISIPTLQWNVDENRKYDNNNCNI